MNDPETPEQWQIAVDAAEGVLAIKLCQLFGFIEGGGILNADRCADIIGRGEKLGIKPSPTAVSDFVVEVSASEDRERMLRVVKQAVEMSGNPKLSDIVPFLARDV